MGNQMFISRIILKNWRNFRTASVDMGKRVFVVGPNASGKSNFLDVLRFLRDISKPGGGLQRAISERGGLSKIRCLAARQEPDIEIEVWLSDILTNNLLWKYAIKITQDPSLDEPFLAMESVHKDGHEILSRPNKDDGSDKLRLTQTHLEQINTNVGFRDIAKYFTSILYLHLIPQLLKHPMSFSGPDISDDPFGGNFLDRLSSGTDRTRSKRLKTIEKVLRLAVPQLKQLTYKKDSRGLPHLQAIYSHWRSKGAKQLEDQFSDGTLRLIGLLWSLLDHNSLLLLEEPELSLNSGIIRALPSLIFNVQSSRERQIIISTHSSDLLSDQGIGGDEVLLLSPSSEGTEILRASSKREIRDLLNAGLSAADVIIPYTRSAEFEQLKFPDIAQINDLS